MFHSPQIRLGLLAASMLFASTSAQAAPAQPAAKPALFGWAKATTEGVFVGGGYFPGVGWRDESYARTFAFPGTTWSLLNLKGKQLELTTERPKQEDGPLGWYASGRSKKDANYDAPVTLALSAPHAAKAQPRLPRPQGLNQPLYIQSATKLLQSQGLQAKNVRLSQLLRVDLDGDGTEEVLIGARSRPDYGHTPETKVGDYNLTALRFISKGQVKTVPLDVEIHKKSATFSAPGYSEFLACADIDGDGTMEIVLSTGYYEGFGLDIWKFDGQTARRVMSAGWGV